MKFRNLANIEASIAGMFARVDLGKADIFAFQVNRTGDGDAVGTFIGLREYRDGQGVIFVRKPESFMLRFRQLPNLNKMRFQYQMYLDHIRVADVPRGTDRPNDDVCVVSWEIDCPDVLKAVADNLDKIHGKQFDPSDHGRLPIGEWDPKARKVDSSDLCRQFNWFEPEWLQYEPVPGLVIKHSRTREQEIARLEISALRALGASRRTVKDIYECLAEAANIAWVNIDRGSEEEKRLMVSLVSMLKEEVIACDVTHQNTPMESSFRCDAAQALEWALTKRAYWLWELDRKKEADALATKLAMLRLELIQHYNAKRLLFMRPGTDEMGKAVLAFTCLRLARVIRRTKFNQESLEVKLLQAQAAELRKNLKPYESETLEKWLATEPALPYRITGAGHHFGHYDW